MRALECAWEPEMLRAIAEGRWPERCEDDLREHLAACGTCADLIEVAVALARDRESAVRSAPVPGSGVVWWRTQLRMRREAERSAQRTLTLVQGAILGACSIVALGVLGWVSPPPHVWLEPFASGVDGAGPAAITHAIPWSNRIFLALVAWLFLILAAVRFALTDDAAGPLLSGSARGSAPRPLAPTARRTSSNPARPPDRTTRNA